MSDTPEPEAAEMVTDLSIAIMVDGAALRLTFSQPVAFVAFAPDEMIELGRAMIEAAADLLAKKIATSPRNLLLPNGPRRDS